MTLRSQSKRFVARKFPRKVKGYEAALVDTAHPSGAKNVIVRSYKTMAEAEGEAAKRNGEAGA